MDEEMILRACKTGLINFLYTMFAYNKNYQEIMSEKKYQKMIEYLGE